MWVSVSDQYDLILNVREIEERRMLAEIFGMDGIVVVAILAVVLFGGAAIPKLARNLGSAKNQFEKGLDEGKRASSVESPVVTSVTSSEAPITLSK
jgi:sec-independent protein translocase protein TatA